jgi:hypothetical protein
VNELKAAADAAQQARNDLWGQIAATPAQTMVGIAVKLAGLMHYDDALREAWNGKSPVDIPSEMFLAARQDAMRLAGLPHTFGADEPDGEYQAEAESEEVWS